MQAAEYLDRIRQKRGAERELEALAAVKTGEVPSIFTTPSAWSVVTIRKEIDGLPYRLDLRVAPNFFAVGDDGSPFFLPMWPTTAQKVADRFNAILPTKRIADAVYAAAEIEVPIVTPGAPWYVAGKPGDIGDSEAWYDATLRKRAQGPAGRFGKLVDGHSKNLIVSPKDDGARVRIYGARRPDGSYPLQAESAVHAWNYLDYSHGTRLISRNAVLNGQPIDLMTVFMDPKVSALVSDDGPFLPKYPINGNNIGAGISALVKTPGAPAPALEKSHASPPLPPKTTPPSEGGGDDYAVPMVAAAVAAVLWFIFS